MEKDNKTVVRRYYEEVGNTGNIGCLEEFISDDYTEIHNGMRYQVGIQGAKAHIIGVRQTYPDLHITIERQIAEEEWVATCITAHGTHLGTWLDMKPTGKKVTITGVNVDRVVGGLICEHSGAANMLEALLEIGAIRVVGPEGEQHEPEAGI
jgi:predicted ester cyclase